MWVEGFQVEEMTIQWLPFGINGCIVESLASPLNHHSRKRAVDSHALFFKPEHKPRSQIRRVWNIKRITSALGASVCTGNLLFLHAILRCDTTDYGSVHGIGKASALKNIEPNSMQIPSISRQKSLIDQWV